MTQPAAPVFGFGAAAGASPFAGFGAAAAAGGAANPFGAPGGGGAGALGTGFQFGASPFGGAGAAAKKADGEGGGDEEDGADGADAAQEECKAEFAALVELKEVDTVTGEEEEEVLHEMCVFAALTENKILLDEARCDAWDGLPLWFPLLAGSLGYTVRRVS